MNQATANAMLIQQDALRFGQADINEDMELEWDEFYHMQPPKVRRERSVAEIREWFEEADEDGDGTVSVHEFFRWTLTRHLKGIEDVFRRYDNDGVGSLDLAEFTRVADDSESMISGDRSLSESMRTEAHISHMRVCVRAFVCV